jgi:GntR family transcriptional regulator
MAQPRYLEIAEDLRSQIESGTLSPGSQLPTEQELGKEYEASRNTIRDAIKRLVGEGLIETRPGQGTFVTKAVIPFVTVLTAADPRTGFGGGEGATYLYAVHEDHRRPSVTSPKVEIQVPPEPVRLRLRLPKGEQTILRHQERYIDDIAWSLQTSFYPMSFVTDEGATNLLMASDIQPGTVAYLAEHGHRQKGYRDWITGRSPDENEQRFFKISHESTVFEIFRTAFDQKDMPMRVTVTIFPADRNQFIVDVGDDLPAPEYDLVKPGEEDDA